MKRAKPVKQGGDGRLRAKIPALRETLEVRFDRRHALDRRDPAHLDFLPEQIASLSDAIAEQIAPFEKAVEAIIAEICVA